MLAPLAVKLVVVPGQIVALAVAVTVGLGATVTCTVVVPVQPLPLVPVMEYTVVATGVAVTMLPVEVLKEPAGDQVYVLAPLTLSVAEAAGQMVVFVEAVKVGVVTTVTAVVFVPTQPLASLPVMV